MKKILLILLIVLGSISFVIFNDKGNEYLKPYLATYLEKKLDNGMSVTVQHLKVNLDYVELTAMLNELTEVKAQGDFSLLSQTFDIDYQLNSDGFKNEQITFDNKVNIEGTVKGTVNNMDIEGEGETLKSHIKYTLNVKDDVISNIKVNINKADIASLLQLTGQAAFAKGKLDVDINIPSFKELDTKGKAKIILHKTTLDEKIFKKVLDLDLPPKTILTADLNSKISAEVFELEGNIKSNLAWLKLSNARYSTKTKAFNTNYKLLAPQLSKLIFLTQQKLQGQLQIEGLLNLKEDNFLLTGNSKDLGGEIAFDYNGQKLNAHMNSIEIAKLLYLLNEKPYATGKIIANVKVDDLNNLRGNYEIKTKDAKTIHPTLKKELNVDFGKSIAFTLESKGDIAAHLANLESSLFSDVFQYRSADMTYNLKSKKLNSSYKFDIPELSKLSTLTGQALKGELSINGEINYAQSFEVTGSTKNLGGELNFTLANQQLNSKINNVSVEKLMYILSYPQVFKASIVGDFYYDLKTQKGRLVSNLNKAQLLSNQLTVLIKQIRGLDLTKERYTQTHFNATLNKNLIDIDFKAKSKNVLLSIPKGRINKASNTIDASYLVNIENKDIGGKIQGNISKPKVTIDSSNFIQEQVIDVIKKNIPEDTLKKLGFEKLEADAIKDKVNNLLGDLFK